MYYFCEFLSHWFTDAFTTHASGDEGQKVASTSAARNKNGEQMLESFKQCIGDRSCNPRKV